MRKWFSVALLTVVGISLVALFVSIVAPPSTGRPNVFVALPDPLEIVPARGRPIPPMDVAQALKGSREWVQKGKPLFASRCVSCHGSEGLGNGPVGTSLNPPPRNFTTPNGWKNGYSVTKVFETVTQGLGGMPAFDYLSAEERFALAHYVQSLGSFPHGAEPADAASYLNARYKLAEGGFEPHRVPLSVAQRRMLSESRQAAIEMPAPNETSEAADLLRSIIKDPERAAVLLFAAPGWQEDDSILRTIAAAGAPANGFAPAVSMLNRKELETLQRELKARLKVERVGDGKA